MAKITLENMEFHAFHGCMEHEQEYGNTFFVTLTVEFDSSASELSDALSDTLDFQKIYDIVELQMSIRSNLLEHVARRILDTITYSLPSINAARILLSKANPPLRGKVEKSSVEISV
jgi:dihydroneopterin aldolase